MKKFSLDQHSQKQEEKLRREDDDDGVEHGGDTEEAFEKVHAEVHDGAAQGGERQPGRGRRREERAVLADAEAVQPQAEDDQQGRGTAFMGLLDLFSIGDVILLFTRGKGQFQLIRPAQKRQTEPHQDDDEKLSTLDLVVIIIIGGHDSKDGDNGEEEGGHDEGDRRTCAPRSQI